jgi:hypothetical protein
MGRRRWIFLWLLLLALPATARSQEKGRYQIIPFQGDPAKLLRERLIQAEKFDRFTEVIAKLKRDHPDFKGFEKLIVNPDHLPEDIQQIVKEFDEGKGTTAAEAKALQNRLQKEADKLAASKPAEVKEQAPIQPEVKNSGSDSSAAPADPADPFQDRLGRWALDMLEKAEDTKIGDMIQQSAAWKNAVTDLKEALANPGTTSKSWRLDLDKLSLPAGMDAALEKTWERIRHLEMPSLPQVDFSAPNLGVGQSLSKLPVPRRWPIEQSVWWIGAALGMGLILWQFWKRAGIRKSAATTRPLGPWPIHPGRITTAAELIAAFEYLAAVRLGLHIRTWNHRAVAGELGREGDERQRAAGKLASLYERARYSPEQASLSTEALADARHDLCFLAGVALP